MPQWDMFIKSFKVKGLWSRLQQWVETIEYIYVYDILFVNGFDKVLIIVFSCDQAA